MKHKCLNFKPLLLHTFLSLLCSWRRKSRVAAHLTKNLDHGTQGWNRNYSTCIPIRTDLVYILFYLVSAWSYFMVWCQRTRKTGKFTIDYLTIEYLTIEYLTIDLPLEPQLWSHVESGFSTFHFLCLLKSTRKNFLFFSELNVIGNHGLSINLHIYFDTTLDYLPVWLHVNLRQY